MKSRVFFSILFSICLFLLLLGCSEILLIGGAVPHDQLVDGTYEGSYKGGPVKAIVKVTIENQEISKIEPIKHDHLRGAKAEKIIPDRIIEKQSTAVDVVTGATRSSKVIMNAVQRAIEKAMRSSTSSRG